MNDQQPVFSTKALFSGCVSVVVAAVVGVLAFSYYGSRATRYCPLSHKFNDVASCYVLHSREGRVLIQHGDLDINDYYLEIIDPDGRRREFHLPESITQLAPQGYSAQLIPGEDEAILLNDKRTTLKRLR